MTSPAASAHPAACRSPRGYMTYGLHVRSPILLPFLRCREDLPAAGPLRLDALADRIEAHVRETVPGRA